jgi:hypothetical protein
MLSTLITREPRLAQKQTKSWVLRGMVGVLSFERYVK